MQTLKLKAEQVQRNLAEPVANPEWVCYPKWLLHSINNEESPNLMRMKGLEPPRLAALEPKSSASTNSATSAGRL